MKKLEGKVALVTGGSRGIGASISEHLAAEGAMVIVNYARNEEEAKKVVARIEKAGGRALALQADVSKRDEVEKLFAEINKKSGALDVLVNNAGVFTFTPFEEIDEDHFYKHFDINVLGLIYVTQSAIKLLKDGGAIVNVSSIASKRPGTGNMVYAATKAAVDSLTVSLSAQLGPRQIRVNSVNPGMVETDGFEQAGLGGSEFEKAAIATTPMARIAKPDEVAKVVAFLASGDAGWVSGESILIAGGRR